MLTLDVKNIHKSFGHHPILRGVSFSAQKGEVIALMGSSGSGKSTLLRCINLLTIPDMGSIQLDQAYLAFQMPGAKQVTTQDMIQLRTKVGMVFQQFNLWAHMTVLENLIEAPMHVLKQKKEDSIQAAEQLLQKVGLLAKRDHYPAQLSGGQQQRAAIARALMMKPAVMLFDEPTSALDPEMVGEVLAVMQQLAAEGMTMIVATHELRFAHRLANQGIFLHEGKIIEQGKTDDLFRNPQTERFKQFLQAIAH
ncbi:MAG TPA: amino acid ABC transporter ATP-binding protein [Gammaproteobacteria bacterium]|jgi:ABC-type histidine transport system ATPase subunit|nr:amino acid ABC transporter ATP-binding protein [Gammaproteobacteria bacterium]